METYIVTVDGTAYEVTVQKKSQLQPECTPQAAPAHPQTKESKIAAAPAAAVDENALKVTSTCLAQADVQGTRKEPLYQRLAPFPFASFLFICQEESFC